MNLSYLITVTREFVFIMVHRALALVFYIGLLWGGAGFGAIGPKACGGAMDAPVVLCNRLE